MPFQETTPQNGGTAGPALRQSKREAQPLSGTELQRPPIAALSSEPNAEQQSFTASDKFALQHARRGLAALEKRLGGEPAELADRLNSLSKTLNPQISGIVVDPELSRALAPALWKAESQLAAMEHSPEEQQKIIRSALAASEEIELRHLAKKRGWQDLSIDETSVRFTAGGVPITASRRGDALTDIRAHVGGLKVEFKNGATSSLTERAALAARAAKQLTEEQGTLRAVGGHTFDFSPDGGGPTQVVTPFDRYTVSTEKTTAYRAKHEAELKQFKAANEKLTAERNAHAKKPEVAKLLKQIEERDVRLHSEYDLERPELASLKLTEPQKALLKQYTELGRQLSLAERDIRIAEYRKMNRVLVGTHPETSEEVYVTENVMYQDREVRRASDNRLIEEWRVDDTSYTRTDYLPDGSSVEQNFLLDGNTLTRRTHYDAEGKYIKIERWNGEEHSVENSVNNTLTVFDAEGRPIIVQPRLAAELTTVYDETGRPLPSFQAAKKTDPKLTPEQYLAKAAEWAGGDIHRLGRYFQRMMRYEPDFGGTAVEDDWQTAEQTLNRLDPFYDCMIGDCDDFSFLAQAILQNQEGANPVVAGIPAHALTMKAEQDENGRFHVETIGTYGSDRNGIVKYRVPSDKGSPNSPLALEEGRSPGANPDGFKTLQEAVQVALNKYQRAHTGLASGQEVTVSKEGGMALLAIPEEGKRSYIRAPLEVLLSRSEYDRAIEASKLRSNGSFEKAAEQFSALAEKARHPAAYQFEAGASYLKAGNIEKATELLSAAVQNAPQDADFRMLTASLHLQSGSKNEAAALIRAGLTREKLGAEQLDDSRLSLQHNAGILNEEQSEALKVLLAKTAAEHWMAAEHSQEAVSFAARNLADAQALQTPLSDHLAYRRALLKKAVEENGYSALPAEVVENYLSAIELLKYGSIPEPVHAAANSEREELFQKLDAAARP